ncbi:MAG: baseplate J/gp47 family protein, partial [Chloroflexota bacterium]
DLAETSPRVWRRNRVRPGDRLGYAAGDLEDVLAEAVKKRKRAEQVQKRPEWQRWARSITFVLLGAICLTVFIATIGLITPSATVTVTPAREKVTVQKQITADPSSTSSGENNVIGAEYTAVVVDWESNLVPTGQAQLGANAASGSLVFVNLTDDQIELPAGVVVSTGSEPPIGFQSIAPATLPAISGSTVEVGIIAQEVGPQGNLPSESISRFQDAEAWANLVEIRQPTPTNGGDIQPVPVVTEADLITLKNEMLQQLQSIASNQIESDLPSNQFLVHESLSIQAIIDENQSHQVGEAGNRLVMNIQAEVGGSIIDMNQATDLVYTDLVNAVRPGFSLTPDSFRFYQIGNNTVRDDGLIEFEMVGEGTMTALTQIDDLLDQIAGKDEIEAVELIQENLEIEGEPVIRIIPNWFSRMPNLASRIEVIING